MISIPEQRSLGQDVPIGGAPDVRNQAAAAQDVLRHAYARRAVLIDALTCCASENRRLRTQSHRTLYALAGQPGPTSKGA